MKTIRFCFPHHCRSEDRDPPAAALPPLPKFSRVRIQSHRSQLLLVGHPREVRGGVQVYGTSFATSSVAWPERAVIREAHTWCDRAAAGVSCFATHGAYCVQSIAHVLHASSVVHGSREPGDIVDLSLQRKSHHQVIKAPRRTSFL
jgi:hypothetical protein